MLLEKLRGGVFGGLVGGCGDIVARIVLGHVSRCGECPWWSRMGVCLRGVLLVGVHGSGDFVIGEVRYEILIFLEACVTLRLTEICCVSDNVLPPVASLSGMGL